MLKYFKAITSAEYNKGLDEFEDFIRDNIKPMFFVEDSVALHRSLSPEDLTALFVENEENLYDYILTQQEIRAIKTILDEFNTNQMKLRSSAKSYIYADYLGVIETNKMDFPEDNELPRLILACISISDSKQITYETSSLLDQKETLYFHFYPHDRELKAGVFKTSNDWFWVCINQTVKGETFYRCDGFLGLIKLIEQINEQIFQTM